MNDSPLFGLVLAGGASTRMQRDKATLMYHGRTQLEWAHTLLSGFCAATFVSVRPDQRDEPTRAVFPQIVDRQPGIGPLAGISAALLEHPKVAWLVVACDLPFLKESTVANLIEQRDPRRMATAYRSHHDSLPEPLCAIWEPSASEPVLAHLAKGNQCPRKLLINADCKLIELPDAHALDNINTPEDLQHAATALGMSGGTTGEGSSSRGEGTSSSSLASADDSTDAAGSRVMQGALAARSVPSSPKTLRIQYFAILREQAGRSDEVIDSDANTAAELYEQLRKKHRFELSGSQLKVALNSEFSDWHTPLKDGDTVVFIPPVAGG